jgi:tetratricopeptide (TPR) repeat protein
MASSRIVLAGIALAVSLSYSQAVFSQDARSLQRQATTAFEAKDYAAAASLFKQAAEVDATGKATDLYNAACAYALAGQADAAFDALDASIAAGLDASPDGDPDLKSLHADARWAPLLTRFEAAHPEAAALKEMRDLSKSSAQQYLAARGAIKRGASTTDTSSSFNQAYANVAQFVGAYDEASRAYGFFKPVDDVVAAGFNRAVDAVPVVLAQAKGRQAVFLNESHGQSQTRAANLALLYGLRAEGFDVLALETLSAMEPVARDASHCSNTSLGDPELPTRGYAVSESGYYTRDPVFAELVREALRLGFKLVAYDSNVPGGIASREQNQAENLACVFKENPKARLVVIAGMSHIGEAKDFWVPGGAMAYRFKQLSGIDPLTVDSTTQLHLSPLRLVFPAPESDSVPISFLLENDKGTPYRTDNFDLLVYVPAPSHREDGKPSWLTLGDARRLTRVDVKECPEGALCILEARRVGELPAAVPADSCVAEPPASGCNLFLAPGNYEVTVQNSVDSTTTRLPVQVLER